jgi:hypothetical protein
MCQIVICQVNLAGNVSDPVVLMTGVSKLPDKAPKTSASCVTNPTLVSILLKVHRKLWLVVLAKRTKEQMLCAFGNISAQHR